ncbi:MAG: hypothetical protein FJ148_19795 [Deltaproteobacteria bacterium]|nr:hypothetical protein [Deltaproteobacteria bacterium]
MPATERGLAKSDRARASFELCCPVFLVTGDDEQRFAASRDARGAQIAFQASAPSCEPVLELHGCGALQEEMPSVSQSGSAACAPVERPSRARDRASAMAPVVTRRAQRFSCAT